MGSLHDVLARQNGLEEQPFNIDEILASLSGGASSDMPWEDMNRADVFTGGIPSLPGVQLPAPPMLNTDPAAFLDLQNTINGRIGDQFNSPVPQAQTSLLDGAPQASFNEFGISPELQSFLNGEGFSPKQLALMQTQAREGPAMAGQQQLGQMRRALSEAGITGPAAAAYTGDVARNVGYQQGQNLQNVALQNAQQGQQNKQFGVGLQTQIGMTNQQQANAMAIQNANMMFQALRDNQTAQNQMNQFNTGNQVQQQQQKAAAQSGFTANSGLQFQQQQNANANENANKQFATQLQNTNFDWQKQLLPWQELNQRFGQAVGTLGSWGQ